MTALRLRALLLLLGCLCLIARESRAQVAAALTPGVAAGVGAGLSASDQAATAPSQLIGAEPPDWQAPGLKTSSSLSRGCGVVSEAMLSVTPAGAYLNVVIQNESRQALGFDPGATLVWFGNGPKRRVKTPIPGHLKIEPGWRQWLALQLPDKRDFEGQTLLNAELLIVSPSFGACRLRVSFARAVDAPDRPETYSRYSSLELMFGAGVRMFTSGGVHELAPKLGATFAFDFDYYWSLHHGVALDVSLDAVSGSKVATVAPNLDLEGTPNIEVTGFFLGYVGRAYLAQWLSATYAPGVGIVPFQLTDESKTNVRLTSAVACLRHRLRLTLPFMRFADGGEFYAAASLSHTFVPYGRLGTVELPGHLVSALLLLGLGG